MQAVVFQEYPEVWKAYCELSKYGPTLMTGSGTCIYLSTDSQQEANNIYQQVLQSYEAYCVEGLELAASMASIMNMLGLSGNMGGGLLDNFLFLNWVPLWQNHWPTYLMQIGVGLSFTVIYF